MKAGVVVSIRINPRDCQGVLDVMEVAGIPNKDMSFAQQVSLALSSMIEGARSGGIIPEPDEFQYLNRMQPFLGRMRNGQKQKMSKLVNGVGPQRRVTPLLAEASEAAEASQPLMQSEPVEVSLADRGKRTRLAELNSKRDLALSGGGVVWMVQDQIEFEALYLEVYGETWHE